MPLNRAARAGVLALLLAAVGALAFAVPTGTPLQPIGEVQGAVATPEATPVTSSTESSPPDARFAYARPTDRDAPRAGRELIAPPIASLHGYRWPLAKGRISLPFKAIPGGSRIKDGKLFHDGVDMASFCGDTVRAAHSGLVLASGRHFDDQIGWVGDLSTYYRVLDKKKLWDDLPNVVIVDDGNGYRSIYAHMSVVTVTAGEVIRAGQKIGLEGRTGHASGCHVHYGLFSPYETKTFGVRADILHSLRVPNAEIARIDPLLVLPMGEQALKTRQVPTPKQLAGPPPTPTPEPAKGP